ncbi:response regulator [Pseudoroseicyclus sp. CXY001]|uniref:hybrid sensor histidine kinase/response regulator n=1 Tax=Pseudoroseicyclus sp. CXY001 TaxID=3242492 RepID=UPI0035713EC9
MLLVEDNEGDAFLARDRLARARSRAFSVASVTSLAEARVALREARFDAVVLDLGLPDSRGIESFRRLRRRVPSVPIVILSGQNDDDAARAALREGAEDVLSKSGEGLESLPRAILYAMERFQARQADAQLQQLISDNPDGMLVTDAGGAVQFVNAAALDLFGVDRETFMSQEIGFSFGDDAMSEVEILRGGARRTAEVRLGHIHWHGQRAVLATLRDVTESRHMADQLREAQKLEAVGLLAGGIAHDFNNLLLVILGNAEFLLDELAPGAPGSEEAEQIIRAAEQAAMLTGQLLAFSRRDEAVPELFRPCEALQRLGAMIRRVLPPDITLELPAGAGEALIEIAPTSFDQVILNLVFNARHAMPGGGRLTISLDESAPHEVRISVRDTGTGIPAENLTRIFEPFFTTRAAGTGTGLGLPTCRRILHDAGGEIRAESPPGGGACFTLTLPRSAPARAAGEGATAGEPAPAPGPPPRILLAEDNPEARQTIARSLERAGYHVVTAADGREAQALIEASGAEGAEGFDLVLSDAVMPHMSGVALSRWLAETRPALPFLLITGLSTEIGEGLGAPREVLRKPFEREALLARLAALLPGPTSGR